MDAEITDWLMAGDPSVRFQTMRDILGSDAKEYGKEQSKISKQGWGERLLSLQDTEGTWAGGLYVPKWTSTTYTMLLLRRLGLEPGHPRTAKACKLLLDEGFYTDDGINYFGVLNHSEVGVTGMILSIIAYFRLNDSRVHEVARFLINEQLDYGGWFYLSPQGRTDICFHTTMCVLEGLCEYRRLYQNNKEACQRSLLKGIEFLLKHRLYKLPGIEDPIHPSFTKFSFPPRYRYDVMRALDLLQVLRVQRDPRMEDAIGLIEAKRRKDGTWPLQQRWPGKTYFEMEQAGKPSRWNTLRALRILKWWNDE